MGSVAGMGIAIEAERAREPGERCATTVLSRRNLAAGLNVFTRPLLGQPGSTRRVRAMA